MSKLIAPLALAALLAAPTIAETSSNFAFQFRFDQSELANPKGAARVHQQLKLEANTACRLSAPSAQRRVDSECREALVEAAVKRINNPLLTQAHAGAPMMAMN